MTARTLLLRATAAVAAGLAAQMAHAEMRSPILAMATGQWFVASPARDVGTSNQAPQAADPSLSLAPTSPLQFPEELTVGGGTAAGEETGTGRRTLATNYNPLQLGMDRNFPFEEKFITSPPSIFDTVGDYFDGENFEWPLGIQQSVFIMPTPARGTNKLIPFIDLLQDGDERNGDAHLRWGAGVGLKYLINSNMSIDTELMSLESAGDHNPANERETRFMMVFSVRF